MANKIEQNKYIGDADQKKEQLIERMRQNEEENNRVFNMEPFN